MEKIKQFKLSNVFSRIGQILGIAVLGAFYYAIIHEHVANILLVLREYPGDFWHNYIWLILRNIGG